MHNPEYFQIFERDHPVIGAHFSTKKEARDYLKEIASQIQTSNNTPFLFNSYQRKLAHLPLRDMLFLRKVYADGHEENVTLLIRTMKMTAQHNNIF